MFKATEKFIWRYKRQKVSSKDTFETLRPIGIISYITGFRIFEYPRGRFWTKFSLLYATVLYCIYYIGWTYQRPLLRDKKVFNLQGAVYRITSAFNQAVMFVMIFVGWHQSKTLRQSVRRIHEVDVTLRVLGSPGRFETIYKKIIRLLMFAFSQLIIFVALHIIVHVYLFPISSKKLNIVCSIFIQFYGQIVEFIMVTEFVGIVGCIGSEFQRVNNILGDINVLPSSSIAMELLDHNNSKDPFSTDKSFFDTSAKLFTLFPFSRRLRSNSQITSHEVIRSRRLLQTIRQVHLELYKVSKRISMIYGIQTSMEMSLCILYTTYFIYCLYYTYQYESYRGISLTVTTIGTFLLCFSNAMKIFSVNYICEKTSQQAQRTNEIIYTFYGHTTDSELREEIEMFSLQMMHCQVIYSASGLYAFNYKNICSNLGFIATYVVIMIQVTSSIEEELS